jgi:hypothetical protein
MVSSERGVAVGYRWDRVSTHIGADFSYWASEGWFYLIPHLGWLHELAQDPVLVYAAASLGTSLRLSNMEKSDLTLSPCVGVGVGKRFDNGLVILGELGIGYTFMRPTWDDQDRHSLYTVPQVRIKYEFPGRSCSGTKDHTR